MAAKKKSKSRAKSRTAEVVTRKRVTRLRPAKPTVETVTTETDIITRPRVEIRRAATLSQALTEPAVAVVKPERKAITRVVRRQRKVA
jgi:hypothetical protein